MVRILSTKSIEFHTFLRTQHDTIDWREKKKLYHANWVQLEGFVVDSTVDVFLLQFLSTREVRRLDISSSCLHWSCRAVSDVVCWRFFWHLLSVRNNFSNFKFFLSKNQALKLMRISHIFNQKEMEGMAGEKLRFFFRRSISISIIVNAVSCWRHFSLLLFERRSCCFFFQNVQKLSTAEKKLGRIKFEILILCSLECVCLCFFFLIFGVNSWKTKTREREGSNERKKKKWIVDGIELKRRKSHRPGRTFKRVKKRLMKKYIQIYFMFVFIFLLQLSSTGLTVCSRVSSTRPSS